MQAHPGPPAASAEPLGVARGPGSSSWGEQVPTWLRDAAPPFCTVFVKDGLGFVWDADGAAVLRVQCRLVGSMVGGLAGYRQQVAVNGLPLQLSPEEVTLAYSKGWVRLSRDAYEPPATAPRTAGAAPGAQPTPPAAPPAGAAPASAGRSIYHRPKKKQKQKPSGGGGGGGGPAAAELPPAERAVHGDAHGHVTFAVQRPGPRAPPGAGAGAPGSNSEACWAYPSSAEERRRYAVFADLHTQGYTLTAGVKFGADFLAYPGDPMLYHAQFTVRVARAADALQLYATAAAVRTTHTARKHLLIATVEEGEDQDSSVTDNAVSALTGNNNLKPMQPGNGAKGGTHSASEHTDALDGIKPFERKYDCEQRVLYFTITPDVMQSSNKRRFAEEHPEERPQNA